MKRGIIPAIAIGMIIAGAPSVFIGIPNLGSYLFPIGLLLLPISIIEIILSSPVETEGS